ncbi:putative acid phosphatase, partial [Vibrio parahaemolyticus IDH02640]
SKRRRYATTSSTDFGLHASALQRSRMENG